MPGAQATSPSPKLLVNPFAGTFRPPGSGEDLLKLVERAEEDSVAERRRRMTGPSNLRSLLGVAGSGIISDRRALSSPKASRRNLFIARFKTDQLISTRRLGIAPSTQGGKAEGRSSFDRGKRPSNLSTMAESQASGSLAADSGSQDTGKPPRSSDAGARKFLIGKFLLPLKRGLPTSDSAKETLDKTPILDSEGEPAPSPAMPVGDRGRRYSQPLAFFRRKDRESAPASSVSQKAAAAAVALLAAEQQLQVQQHRADADVAAQSSGTQPQPQPATKQRVQSLKAAILLQQAQRDRTPSPGPVEAYFGLGPVHEDGPDEGHPDGPALASRRSPAASTGLEFTESDLDEGYGNGVDHLANGHRQGTAEKTATATQGQLADVSPSQGSASVPTALMSAEEVHAATVVTQIFRSLTANRN